MTSRAHIDEVRRLLAAGDALIDGALVRGSGEPHPVTDPATGAELGTFRSATPGDVDLAVAAARRAHSGWWALPAEQRAEWLRRLADAIEGSGSLAVIETLDTGHPHGEVTGELPAVAQVLRYYASLCGDGAASLRRTSGRGTSHDYTLRDPVGVVGAIVPWNYPLSLMVEKMAPALAAGNTVVVKPAEQTPLSALLVAQLTRETGMPPGVVNVVNGPGDRTGAALAGHPGVDLVTFTGSSSTGRRVMAAASAHLTPVILELGGKSPVVVFDDSDVQAAAATCAFSFTTNAGQLCTAGTRLIAHEDVHDDLVEEVVRHVERLRVGPPWDPETQVGALISQEQLTRVSGYVDRARDAGAEPVCGGTRLRPDGAPDGFYYAPTVFSGVEPGWEIARDEIFGPVLTTFSFRTEDEAVALANGTTYGLAAGVWTTDVDRAHRMAGLLDAGVVWVNTYNSLELDVPHAGRRGSGFGVEGGPEGMWAMTHPKSVSVAPPGTAPVHEHALSKPSTRS